ncbi:MAG: hypothetical protein JSR54_17150, partial [Proteobacteria bacterium]|nr:hypothetical protein [Pseudomonadota bacterium]
LADPASPAGRVAARLGLEPPAPGPARRQIRALGASLAARGDALSLRAFLAVYHLSYAAALPAADLVLDVDRLTASARERRAVQDALHGLTGTVLDLGDCRAPRHDPAATGLDLRAIEREAERDLAAAGIGTAAAGFDGG